MLRSQRWLPLSGVAFVVLFVVAFFIAGSSPDTSGSGGTNAKIAAYLAKTSNFHHNIAALLMAFVALLLLACFFSALRDAITGFGEHTTSATLAFGAGLLSLTLLLISTTMFIVPVLAAHDARPAPLDPNIYRLTQDCGFALWIAAGGFGGLAIFATSAATFTGSVFPRWFAWFGVVCGILALLSFFFLPMFVYWLWILVASVMLLRPRGHAGSSRATTPLEHAGVA